MKLIVEIQRKKMVKSKDEAVDKISTSVTN